MSAMAGRSDSNWLAGPWTRTVLTGARIDCLASDLALRIAPMTVAAIVIRPVPAARGVVAGAGHGFVCTESSCHHDHASSAQNGRTGAKSLSRTDRAERSESRADWAEAPPPSSS